MKLQNISEEDRKFIWNEKRVVDRESSLILRKIKETIHSFKNPNLIKKVSYMLPEVWLPHLQQFLVVLLSLKFVWSEICRFKRLTDLSPRRS